MQKRKGTLKGELSRGNGFSKCVLTGANHSSVLNCEGLGKAFIKLVQQLLTHMAMFGSTFIERIYHDNCSKL